MNKIIIMGKNGMLGHVLERYLKEKDYSVMGIDRTIVDVSNFKWLIEFLRLHQDSTIINCTGALGPEKDRQKQIDVNIIAPQLMAKYSKRLIHVSTNCVFQGIGPHPETDVPDAVSLYGQCKAYGEIINDKDLTIRCSITGPEIKTHDRSGLFDWFVNQAPDKVQGFKQAYWNGVTTLQLAKFIEEAIENDYTGLLHYYTKNKGNKFTNKYELLNVIKDIYEVDKEIEPVDKSAHTSILTGKHYTKNSYEEQFKELKEWY